MRADRLRGGQNQVRASLAAWSGSGASGQCGSAPPGAAPSIFWQHALGRSTAFGEHRSVESLASTPTIATGGVRSASCGGATECSPAPVEQDRTAAELGRPAGRPSPHLRNARSPRYIVPQSEIHSSARRGVSPGAHFRVLLSKISENAASRGTETYIDRHGVAKVLVRRLSQVSMMNCAQGNGLQSKSPRGRLAVLPAAWLRIAFVFVVDVEASACFSSSFPTT